jgi:hypothetical protein
MKTFTQSQMSKNAFLEALYKSVNWRFVLHKLREKYKIIVGDEVAYVNGDFVVHDNEPACRLDIDVTIRLSVICDNAGNCLSLSTTRPDSEGEKSISGKQDNPYEKIQNSRRQEMAAMATGLADMIADINNEVF